MIDYTETKTKVEIPREVLRDWFAGQALASSSGESKTGDSLAAWCYKMADAMLKARDQ